MLAMTVALIGIFSPVGPFWALPTSLLGGAAAAAGIAVVNSVGNLGGFTGPYLVGLIQGRYPKGTPMEPLGVRYALIMLACVGVVGCITALLLQRERTLPIADETEPAPAVL